MIIKAGILISYDYKYLKIALPLLYKCKDISQIYLAIDADYKTWSGQTFNISDDFFTWIEEFDTEKRIVIYKDHFYIPELSPMECDTRERQMLAKKVGKYDWFLQVDTDEYIPNIQDFVNQLKTITMQNPNDKISVTGKLVTLFKMNTNEFFVVKPIKELIWLATNSQDYQFARVNHNHRLIKTDTLVIHQSWARSQEEIQQKIANWGHKTDFDVDAFFKSWENLDSGNYKNFKNFHPLTPKEWEKLTIIKNYSVEEFSNLKESKIRRLLRFPFLQKWL